MSVRDRLEDARLLWQQGRKTGAWIQVLIAAAATSRQRFPALNDNKAFKAFIREVTPTLLDGTKPAIAGGIEVCFFEHTTGDRVSLADVMYSHLRCNLVHEAIMPVEVKLCDSRIEDGQLVADLHGVGTLTSPLTIPDFWVMHLAKAVADAPENAAACAGLF